MKAVVYVIVQSVIAGGEEHKNIHGVYTFKHQAQDRMNEIVVVRSLVSAGKFHNPNGVVWTVRDT